MAKLWQCLTQIYGNQFTRRFGEVPSVMWCEGLNDLSEEKLKQGVSKLLSRAKQKNPSPWAPNLIEFRALCQRSPEDYQLPSAESAYDIIIASLDKQIFHWKHPIVYHAAKRFGAYKFAHDLFSFSQRRDFEATYLQVCDEFMKGKPFPVAPAVGIKTTQEGR